MVRGEEVTLPFPYTWRCCVTLIIRGDPRSKSQTGVTAQQHSNTLYVRLTRSIDSLVGGLRPMWVNEQFALLVQSVQTTVSPRSMVSAEVVPRG